MARESSSTNVPPSLMPGEARAVAVVYIVESCQCKHF